ncbi:hypothetical protein ACONUD_13395 [Microbulbifer harenosus]|uniref:Uncharacterized protein n=1 Tax=Microbulbifer harenosus TaxID=2576840 RepID=A0ABY2UMH6_9GAMM|nr:hypothetical protein [Microbulbifer harenosus]TLM79343.1 hypothetical protein FDY93_04410 [Microbulbifer harenosus]
MFSNQWYQLKLQFREHSAHFTAGECSFRAQLHAAFVRLAASGGEVRATLMVHHRLHGWLKVCDADHRYPIIQNPLRLDCTQLFKAVRHTLQEADRWPSDEEKLRRRLERQTRRRAEDAMARRSRFHIVRDE